MSFIKRLLEKIANQMGLMLPPSTVATRRSGQSDVSAPTMVSAPTTISAHQRISKGQSIVLSDTNPGLNPYLLIRTLEFLRSLLEGTLDNSGKVMFDGHLFLAHTRLRKLPGNLHVNGTLDLQQCQRFRGFGGDILSVNGDLKIGGKSNFPIWWHASESAAKKTGILNDFLNTLSKEGSCPIGSLPQQTSVKGDLVLRGCKNLKQLPGDIKIGESLEIVGASLTSLGTINRVEGNLSLVGCPIESLPEGLEVTGDARLEGLAIKSLPSRMKIGGNLILGDCRQLSGLPKDLEIGGNLKIHRCPVAILDQPLQVGKSLHIKAAPVKTLSVRTNVGGNVSLRRCDQLERIEELPIVAGDLEVIECRQLTNLPERLIVHGRAILNHCVNLEKLPSDLTVKGKISPLARTTFFQGRSNAPSAQTWRPTLELTGCLKLTDLPNMEKVAGSIDLADTGITKLTESQLTGLVVRWRGVAIPSKFLFRPETIQPVDVLSHRNAEIRRVLLERMGIERLINEADSTIIDEDTDPGGRRRLISFRGKFERPRGVSSPIQFLNCICPSTGREYLLQVPTTVVSCHDAAAWLAGFNDPDEYQPLIET